MPDVISLVPTSDKKSWLEYEHKEYRELLGRWTFTYDHYTGEVCDPAKVKQYLRKRTLGESLKAFEERCSLADYTNHFGAIVDSIAGMLFAVEGDANRVFNQIVTVNNTSRQVDVLGAFDQPNTTMGQLFLDADGNGNSYLTVFKSLATELLAMQSAWVLVDAGNDGNPTIKVYPVTSVTNWLYDQHGLKYGLIKERVDGRANLQQAYEEAEKTSYLLIGRESWERWERGADGEPKFINSGEHTYKSPNGSPAAPLFRVSLPLRRMVGWQLAVKANRIFNKESERDTLLRLSNNPKLNLVAGDTLFEKIVTGLEEGSNALQNDPSSKLSHSYIAPSSEPANILSKVIERKVEEFYISAFRMYGDSAKEKTATEARQDVSQGIGAFLQMLKGAVDSAENQVLWRLEQIVYPKKPAVWFTSRVERSDNFLPVNVDASIDKIRERYFGKGGLVPVGKTTLIAAIKTMLQWDGLQMSEDEIDAAVDAHILARGFADVTGQNLPAEALIQHMMRVFVASGILPTTTTLDATKIEAMASKLRDEIQKSADAASETPPTKVTYQGVSTDHRTKPENM